MGDWISDKESILIAIGTTLALFLAAKVLLRWGCHHLERISAKTATSVDDHLLEALKATKPVFLFRLALWSTATLLIISNLGYDVTALIAGLGIGGIAIGLAMQNILGDLFASLSIVLDKPFEVGDFIIVRAFAERGIEFAYPTRTLFVSREEAEPVSPADSPSTEGRNVQPA